MRQIYEEDPGRDSLPLLGKTPKMNDTTLKHKLAHTKQQKTEAKNRSRHRCTSRVVDNLLVDASTRPPLPFPVTTVSLTEQSLWKG